MDNQKQHTEAKTCPKCRTAKPISEFYTYVNHRGVLVFQSYCKACKKAKMREYRRKERDGMVDGRTIKGYRAPYGARHTRAKLTEDDVRAIRALKPMSAREVAEKFEVSRQLIWNIWCGRAWEHVG